MNIGNFKSVADRDAKQKLQAEYLQLLIDNQAELEKRVKNYQNPNIAPPVPPQYKSTSELEKDSLKQEKDVIDNVLSLSPSLNFSDASSVAEDLRSRGLDALVKFNRNFPLIKKKLLEDINPRLLNAQVIIAKIDDIFGKIDATFGLQSAGYKSENYFARTPQELIDIYPTRELIAEIDESITTIQTAALINNDPQTQEIIVGLASELNPILDKMSEYLPSETELKFISQFKAIDRDELFKILQQSLIEKVVPTRQVLDNIENELSAASRAINKDIQGGQYRFNQRPQPQQTDELDTEENLIYQSALQQAPAAGGARTPKTPLNIGEVTDYPLTARQINLSIDPTQIPSVASKDTVLKLIGILLNNVSGFNERAVFLLRQFKSKYDKINSEINTKLLSPAGVLEQLSKEEADEIKKKDYVPLGELGALAGQRAEKREALQKLKRNVQESKAQRAEKEEKEKRTALENKVYQTNLPNISARKIAKLLPKAREAASKRQQEELERGVFREITDVLQELTKGEILYYLTDDNSPYKIGSISQLRNEPVDDLGGYLFNQILEVKGAEISSNQYHPSQKQGIYRLITKKQIGLGFTANDEPRERSTFDRISRVPNTQQQSSIAPNNSEMRRIKVGAGVSLKEDKPRYREFGKYRIHIPLLDENVINIKYPSLAGIPSLKPVQVSDQYIDFVKELLDTDDFNHKKYNSLNPKEQDHFAKISKASGLSTQFGIRPKSDDEDEEDYKRLMILKGEWEAGNDNEKLIKELRAKIIKFINNGRIPKKVGLNYLMMLGV